MRVAARERLPHRLAGRRIQWLWRAFASPTERQGQREELDHVTGYAALPGRALTFSLLEDAFTARFLLGPPIDALPGTRAHSEGAVGKETKSEQLPKVEESGGGGWRGGGSESESAEKEQEASKLLLG